jgi:hypothetical protein
MVQLSRTRSRRRLYALAVVVLLGGVLVAGSGVASAAQFDVTNTNDSGPGSLPQAVADAEANAGADTIVVQAGLGTINLTSPLEWNGGGDLTIQGNGVTVDFGGAPNGFVNDGGDALTIDGMTITGVTGSSSDDAAPVVGQGGSMTLSNCTITGNDVTTDDGDVAGGILSEGGPVTVNACTITGNNADGTGSFGDGGGGILNEGGDVTVMDSTISGNTVVADVDAGGGIASEGGDIIVTGSTINCNSATGGNDAAGGILNSGGESFTIRTSSIVGNVATATEGDSENSILSLGAEPVINDSTVSDDTSVCETPPTTPSTEPPGSTPTTGAQQAATQPRFTG